MRKASFFIILSTIAAIQTTILNASETTLPTELKNETPFQPFAAKVTRNKVRMRLKPSLDSAVLRELGKDDLIVVLSEQDDFYAVQASDDIKAYVYRTFVLDNVVEGNHVNVRLEPNIDAPVIVQLNSGDPVTGVISPINSKWLEISVPKSAHFYVSKDFVEKIGEPSLVETISKRRENVNHLLESTYQISEAELKKSYQEIQMEGVFQNLNKIIGDKNNLPEQIDRAKSMQTLIQDKYLQKKLAFLKEPILITSLEQPVTAFSNAKETLYKNPITAKMNSWIPNEEKAFAIWELDHKDQSREEFYAAESQEAIQLQGLLESYDRSVKNKPGDYMLINSSNQLPIGYVYSTIVNLQELLGQEVILNVTPRPNNNFAFPAYFVIDAEK